MKRLLAGTVASLLMLAAVTAGLMTAWANGTSVPGLRGTTFLRAVKVHAHYVDGAPTDHATFMVFVGDDERAGVSGARGDAIHLLAINPRLHAGTIVNFPRDTCTDVPGRGHVRINEANSQGGPGLTAEVIARMTGAPVRYGMTINFAGFFGLVDGVGGVTVNVPFAMHDSYSNADFVPGPKYMNSVLALAFARDRHDFAKGDIQRSWNQGYLMLAAIKKLQSQFGSTSGRLQLAALAVRHARLSGIGITDIVRLGELADQIPASRISNVTIPLGGGGCLDLAPQAAALFSDVRDDGVLEHYPVGTAALPDPRP